ncbi:MAG TPA: histidine phosphatase family protein [Ilumatobacteraceae bacterium]
MPRHAASLLLVRHGQSEWNAVRRWQGTYDSPLTGLGRAQARAVGSALAAELANGDRIAGLWSSDLSRASETALIIANYLGIDHVSLDTRLREADAGPWQGFTPDEIEQRWPGYLASHHRPDGFESAESVVARGEAVCLELLQRAVSVKGAEATIVAVTHSGFIRVLRRHFGADDERIPNLGGAWFHLGDDDHVVVGALDPFHDGVPISGVDGPGEDPGDEADSGDGRGGAERRPAG